MKVLLLRPAANVSGMAQVIPLGLLAIGSALKRAGHSVRLLDLRMPDSSGTGLGESLRDFAPEVVGIGLMTIESDAAFALARQVKILRPGTRVIFGGPHCAHEPRFVLHDPNVDFMVIGEGEETAVDLIGALEGRADLQGIPGIAYRRGDRIIQTEDRQPIPDLDSLETDYSLIDVPRYFRFSCSHEYLPATRRFMPLMTSRGCPYSCIYCHDLFGKSMRFRSPRAVLSEMEFLRDTYGVEEFHILDDVFNINMKRAKQIFDSIVERGMDVKIAFPNGVRADLIDDEMVEKMRSAGVYRLALGIESGSRRIQRMISKSLDIAILKRVVEKLTGAGISVNGFFMLGFPGETREEMEQTIRFACGLDLSTALFSLVIPNPGTELRNRAAVAADANGGFSNYSINAVNGNSSCVETRDLLGLQRRAYRRFYLTPRRAWNLFRTTRSKTLLAAKLWSLLKLTSPWPPRLNFRS